MNEFWQAVLDNEVDTVSEQLKQEPSLAHATYCGNAWKPEELEDCQFTNTALHTAAVNGRDELLQLLLTNGANADAIGFEQNKGLTPPIVLATWEGNLETVQILLDHGADPNVPASAETALYTAAEHGAHDKAELLLARGARHDIFTAAILGDFQFVKRHARAHSTILGARSLKRNRTPEEEAAAHGQTAMVSLLQSLRR